MRSGAQKLYAFADVGTRDRRIEGPLCRSRPRLYVAANAVRSEDAVFVGHERSLKSQLFSLPSAIPRTSPFGATWPRPKRLPLALHLKLLILP
jgi:hypothetical protein